MTGTI